VGPTPSKDGPCTFTAPFDLAAEDLVLDVWNTKHIRMPILMYKLYSSKSLTWIWIFFWIATIKFTEIKWVWSISCFWFGSMTSHTHEGSNWPGTILSIVEP
jgi:hypothetical protein